MCGWLCAWFCGTCTSIKLAILPPSQSSKFPQRYLALQKQSIKDYWNCLTNMPLRRNRVVRISFVCAHTTSRYLLFEICQWSSYCPYTFAWRTFMTCFASSTAATYSMSYCNMVTVEIRHSRVWSWVLFLHETSRHLGAEMSLLL
jgi:hypothetical protein